SSVIWSQLNCSARLAMRSRVSGSLPTTLLWPESDGEPEARNSSDTARRIVSLARRCGVRRSEVIALTELLLCQVPHSLYGARFTFFCVFPLSFSPNCLAR